MSNFTSSYINNVDSTINNTYNSVKDIYSSDIKTNASSNGSNYYKIAFDNVSDTNFYYSILTPTTYTAKNIYLYGLLHNNITGKTDSNSNTVIPPNPPNLPSYIGELVIEHTNSSNSNSVYVFYLLQNNTSKSTSYSNTTNVPNSFDDIISFISNKNNKNTPLISNLNLSLLLPSITPNNSKYIYYIDTKNANNIVIVYLDPIPINNIDNTKFIYKLSTNSNLFSINAPLQPTPIVNSTNPNSTNPNSSNPNSTNQDPTNIKGLNNLNDTSDIYIDCAPTGGSNTQIPTYSLPIGSELIGNKQQMDFIKLSINFLIFLFIAFIVYFTVPITYKRTVIDNAIKLWKNNNSEKIESPLIRIRSIDIWITFFVFIASCYLFIDGFTNNSNSLIIGFFIAIFFLLSVLLIQNNKGDSKYMKTVVEGSRSGAVEIGEPYTEGENTFKYTSISDFLSTFKDGCMFYIYKVLKVHIALIFFILGIASVIYFFIMNKQFNEGFGKLIALIIVALLPISFILRLIM